MNREEKAKRFARLHVKGAPLLLYNAWDAGSARSVLEAGAKAIATSSWSVAAAQGYQDGEAIPIELVEGIVGRIVASVDAPVTVDSRAAIAQTTARLRTTFRVLSTWASLASTSRIGSSKAQGFIASTDKLGGSVLSAK
jgi:2-methylisocitrate lyase-like PEP mutase family enzyme